MIGGNFVFIAAIIAWLALSVIAIMCGVIYLAEAPASTKKSEIVLYSFIYSAILCIPIIGALFDIFWVLCLLNSKKEIVWNIRNVIVDTFNKYNVFKKIGIKRVPFVLWPFAAVLPIFVLSYTLLIFMSKLLRLLILLIIEYAFGFYLCPECKKFRWVHFAKVKIRNRTCCETCSTAYKIIE